MPVGVGDAAHGAGANGLLLGAGCGVTHSAASLVPGAARWEPRFVTPAGSARRQAGNKPCYLSVCESSGPRVAEHRRESTESIGCCARARRTLWAHVREENTQTYPSVSSVLTNMLLPILLSFSLLCDLSFFFHTLLIVQCFLIKFLSETTLYFLF